MLKSGSRLSAALGRDDTSKILLTIDGKFTIPNFNNIEQEAVVDGDNKILSIAAASIIAKVYRDGLMRKLHKEYIPSPKCRFSWYTPEWGPHEPIREADSKGHHGRAMS